MGSKYWQENWEDHVTALEILSGTPIHSVRKTPNERKGFSPLSAYPYSVSKINHLLSLSVLGFWLFIFFYSAWLLFGEFLCRCVAAIIAIIVVCLLCLVLLYMRKCVRSEVVNVEGRDEGISQVNLEDQTSGAESGDTSVASGQEELRFNVGNGAGSFENGAPTHLFGED